MPQAKVCNVHRNANIGWLSGKTENLRELTAKDKTLVVVEAVFLGELCAIHRPELQTMFQWRLCYDLTYCQQNYPLEDGHTTQTLLTDFYSPWLSCDGVGRSESTQLVRENAPLPLLAVVIPCGMDQTASRVIGLRGGHGNGIIVVVLEDTLEKEEIEGVTVKVVIWSSKKKIFGLEKARLLWRPRMA